MINGFSVSNPTSQFPENANDLTIWPLCGPKFPLGDPENKPILGGHMIGIDIGSFAFYFQVTSFFSPWQKNVNQACS